MPTQWTITEAAHLLRRAGFDAHPRLAERAVKIGFEKTLKWVLKVDKRLPKRPKKVDSQRELRGLWVDEMVRSKKPLREKLVLFWHDHFATAISKVGSVQRMHDHLTTLREHATGRFEDLVQAVARDPAMLIWLDNTSNHKWSPNENFARELMELFTTGTVDAVGTPNYTETDVAEVARAFTGWSVNGDGFVVNNWSHDDGVKTVKGITGVLDGGDVVQILADDPATARRVPARLFGWFAHAIDLDDPVADDLALVYQQTDGDILALVEAIFRHDAFWSAESLAGHVKSPAEWLVGSLRLLRAKVNRKELRDVGEWMDELGQSLLDPPSVFGWDQDLAWVGTSGLLARAHVADAIAEAREKHEPVRYVPKKLLGKLKKLDGPEALVDRVLEGLDVAHATPATRSALLHYTETAASGLPIEYALDSDFIDLKVRGLIALILASPDYQLG